MTSTQLANIALGHLGEARIMDLEEQTPQAEHCRRMWNLTRDALLRQRHWNFALRRTVLAQDATAPLFDKAYSYTLPSDYLLAIEVNGRQAGTGEATFDLVGDTIQTNDSGVAMLYVRRETDCKRWDSSFCEAFAYKLAAAIAPSITTAPGLAEKLAQSAEMVVYRAFGPDNLETRPRTILATVGSQWVAARLGVSSAPASNGTYAWSGTTSTTTPTTPATTVWPTVELIIGSDGATYEKATFQNGTITYKPVFLSAP